MWSCFNAQYPTACCDEALQLKGLGFMAKIADPKHERVAQIACSTVQCVLAFARCASSLDEDI